MRSAPRFLTKMDTAAEWLRNEIVSGRVKPGTTLLQDDIAARLGISSTPVREAFVVLEAEGLVERRPHRGVIVADRGYADVAEVYEVRIALEHLAVRKAAKGLTPEVLAELEGALRDERAAIAVPDAHAFRRANGLFHTAFVGAAGSTVLTELVAQLAARSTFNVPLEHRRMMESHREHEQMFAAFQAKDVVRAERVLMRHMGERVRQLRALVTPPTKRPAAPIARRGKAATAAKGAARPAAKKKPRAR